MKKVAVIGCGPVGLASIKSCLEENLDVVCYEACSDLGGVWNYQEKDEPGVVKAKAIKATIMNTSKEMSAFSDFPPPDHFPNYMPISKAKEYFAAYAEHFNLLPCIRFGVAVTKVTKTKDHSTTGRWNVETKKLDDGSISEAIFDAVMVCSGRYGVPEIPQIRGLDKFKGQVMHSSVFKTADQFKDKNVVVIGLGNTGVDIACDLSNQAKNVYLSRRRGAWLLSRLGGPGCIPADLSILTRFVFFFISLLPFKLAQNWLQKKLNTYFNHGFYGLKPQHGFFELDAVLISEELPYKLLSGSVLLKDDIAGFTENSVCFQNDTNNFPIDAVILATGYKPNLSFLDRATNPRRDPEKVDLYKFIFPPAQDQPTMAFVGQIVPFGPQFALGELQSRWVAGVFSGRLKLPSDKVMADHIQAEQLWLKQRFLPGHVDCVKTWISYLDDMATELNVKPNLSRMFWTDPVLAWKCFFGPCLPYQYRLEGVHKWPGARDAILNYWKRALVPLNSKFH